MRRKGFTLMEIVVATVVFAAIVMGLANLFVAGKRYILHSRSRMSGGEVGKLFLDPLLMDVREDQWVASGDYSSSNRLRSGSRSSTAVTVNGISYTPTYTITPAPAGVDPRVRRVRVDIAWQENQP